MRAIAILLLGASMAGAAVLQVGPINLTGSGSFFGPDTSPYGAEGLGGQAILFDASGTNGIHSVTFRSHGLVPVGYSAVALLPNPIFIPLYGCVHYLFYGTETAFPICDVTIDGMTGYSNFTQLGGAGKLQLYSDPLETMLIAEAQINTRVVVKSFAYTVPNNPSVFQSTFDLVTPVTHMPEPGGIYLILVGMAFIGANLSLRRQQNAWR